VTLKTPIGRLAFPDYGNGESTATPVAVPRCSGHGMRRPYESNFKSRSRRKCTGKIAYATRPATDRLRAWDPADGYRELILGLFFVVGLGL
jgi:hypothetical protein